MPGNVVQFVATVLQIYSWLIIARVLLSWIPDIPRDHQLVQALHAVTEPVLAPVRNLLPPLGGAIDLSPLLVFFVLHLIRVALLGSL